jgi:predicted Zn-dependent protease
LKKEKDVTRFLTHFLILGLVLAGCGQSKHLSLSLDPKLEGAQEAIANGNYDAAVSLTREVAAEVPATTAVTSEALYLEAYAMAYGWGDFRQARKPLTQLLALPAEGPLGLASQRLLADCDYWEGYYIRAGREYQKLAATSDAEIQDYANLQEANCLLLKNRVGDAITAYRVLVDKDSSKPVASMAQMMIANIYLKIQNPSQAKTELQKLMSFTKNKVYQTDAQETLRQLEAQAPFQKSGGKAQ